MLKCTCKEKINRLLPSVCRHHGREPWSKVIPEHPVLPTHCPHWYVVLTPVTHTWALFMIWRTTIFPFCHPVPFWWSQPSPRSGWNHIIWQYRFFSSPRCNKLHHIFHPMYRDNVHCLRCPFRFPRVWSQKTISRATVSDHYCIHAVPALSVKYVVGLERKKRIYCVCARLNPA